MKVQDVMSRDIESCTPGTDLAAAAMIMWRNDCGVVPVTNDERKAVGVITDRDICMAVATRHQPAESIPVGDVMSRQLHAVRPEDDLQVVFDKMRHEKVRRVPVVKRDGALAGVLSLNDLVLKADAGNGRAGNSIPGEQVLSVMKAVCEHQVQRPDAARA